MRRELRLEIRGLRESVMFCSDICYGVNSLISDVKDLRREILGVAMANKLLRAKNRKLTQNIEEPEKYRGRTV